MDIKNINEIALEYLSINDYFELKEVMIDAYHNMPNSFWQAKHIQKLIDIFPEGQIAIKVDGKLAGCALAIIIDEADMEDEHTYREVTGDYSFNTHSSKGNTLYGIDVFIKPGFRGLRLGRRLYDYRKELCEKMNLKGIVFGGRLPNYHQFAETFSPKEYLDKVRHREIHDPVL
ncbi:MAG: GNAT family N-acetyltransferase, partial [Flavobacteriaceae bacterium]|nr:GNAT family N-acetyltransferase [Flavobacteriaceae bacterium]